MQRASAYYAIVYLERTGHWTLSEDVDISTKVQVRVDRNELYDIQFPEPQMAALVEILMRKYTGLFSYPVPVDEEYLASRIGVQVPALRQLLYKLSLEHIIKYIPSDHATVLFLHHDRLRPKNVDMDPERYALLKASSTERMQKMIDYISEEDICRSAYLLEYFGQTESADCGTCDVCRGKGAAGVRHRTEEELSAEIIDLVNVRMDGRYALDDIRHHFPMYDQDAALALLRTLIDSGDVPSPEY